MDNTQQVTPPQQTTQPQTPIQSGQTPTQAEPQKKKKGFPFWLLFIVLVLLFAAVAFGAMFFYVQSQQKISFAPPFSKTTEVASLFTFSIESPQDGTLLNDNVLTVRGKTFPNTLVMIYSETDQNSLEASTTGSFEGTVTLSPGINTITVTAFAENGEEKSKTLEIVYDDEA